MKEITYKLPTFYDDIADNSDRHVHLIMIATKPDIIKQIPLYKELKKRGHLVILGHTGQHYDENLSGGMLKEFGVEPDFNLNVRGALHEVVSQIIGRLGHVIAELKEKGKIVIPYVHGDTTTAMDFYRRRVAPAIGGMLGAAEGLVVRAWGLAIVG